MAYFNLLASVPEADLERQRADPSHLLRPSLVLGASHLLASWIEAEPLQELLGQALDGGDVIHDSFWHPLRRPLFHRPEIVGDLSEKIAAAWTVTKIGHPSVRDDEWLAAEMGRLLRLYTHATAQRECVISVLDNPADRERARRICQLWAPQYDG